MVQTRQGERIEEDGKTKGQEETTARENVIAWKHLTGRGRKNKWIKRDYFSALMRRKI